MRPAWPFAGKGVGPRPRPRREVCRLSRTRHAQCPPPSRKPRKHLWDPFCLTPRCRYCRPPLCWASCFPSRRRTQSERVLGEAALWEADQPCPLGLAARGSTWPQHTPPTSVAPFSFSQQLPRFLILRDTPKGPGESCVSGRQMGKLRHVPWGTQSDRAGIHVFISLPPHQAARHAFTLLVLDRHPTAPIVWRCAGDSPPAAGGAICQPLSAATASSPQPPPSRAHLSRASGLTQRLLGTDTDSCLSIRNLLSVHLHS